MSASRYRNFLRLCDQWPLDPTKQSGQRDLGAAVRLAVLKFFSKGELTPVGDVERCDQLLDTLEDLVGDRHRRDFPLGDQLAFGCMLTDLKTLQVVNSDDFHKFTMERAAAPISRWRKLFGGAKK